MPSRQLGATVVEFALVASLLFSVLLAIVAIFDDRERGAKFSLDMMKVEEAGEPEYLYCSELAVACADRLRCKLDRQYASQPQPPDLGPLLDLRLRDDGTYSGANDQCKMVTPKDLAMAMAVEPISGHGHYFHPIDI